MFAVLAWGMIRVVSQSVEMLGGLIFSVAGVVFSIIGLKSWNKEKCC